ncbi:ATP-binding protein [Streptomyces sp. MnatMP-M17]|uniref:ATP-binding protein n=1 Tax=unclassified Streptomyces TaxID=2593676 RepID=UPI00081EEC7D|nr:ATP-binding protein [Streptomyces sp. MnatMP-M17]MYZ39910.1 ATP-binding protein [Streptomyces sp. SID4917]SCG05768.1 Histidine kinase-like ATPase domain-containing protein [Streptomyces sp. MnatMP-M17]
MIGLIDTEDGAEAEWTFPAEPDSVHAARHAVRDTLRTWKVLPAVRDVAVLLVSELVTNSLRYASGPIGVRLALRAGTSAATSAGISAGISTARERPALLVEVSDPLPDPPTERPAGPDDEGGRGIQLVACSAKRWGTRRGKTGKTVWFELPLPG